MKIRNPKRCGKTHLMIKKLAESWKQGKPTMAICFHYTLLKDKKREE